ncbi:MAG: hypothetical protein BGO98_14780 [Myxococcales bacterium 68-20]|nr:MAG: hypothetical protein BGO98_14780 [Myxococcales bacterium 68-20]
MTAIHCSSSRTVFESGPDASDVPPEPFIEPLEASVDAGRVEVECTGTNSQIYVLSSNPAAIHRFDPETLTFTRLGYLDCPATSPFSMAVDRFNNAWVNFHAGKLAKVRLDDLHCELLDFRNPPNGSWTFGMGFARNDDGKGETLFLSSSELFDLDSKTLEVSRVGSMNVFGMPELTGTGDGRLYGFTPDNGVVTRIDKSTGATIETHRTSAVEAGDWAFAQWGGDFWLFTRNGRQASSMVTRYSPETRASVVAVEDSGIVIRGAGSSTCAPFKPVQ